MRGLGSSLSTTTLGTVLAAAVIMGAGVLGVDAVLGAMGWHDAGFIITALRIMVLAGVGGVVFVVAGILLGLQEIRALPSMVLRR